MTKTEIKRITKCIDLKYSRAVERYQSTNENVIGIPEKVEQKNLRKLVGKF